MTREMMTRKTGLQHRLFDPHNPDDHHRSHRRVSPEEVKEFLQLAALSHQAYYQYTDLEALKGMLKSGRLYLTRVADLNDLLECKGGGIADRTYIASFAFGHVENIAMWWMYGFKGDVMRPAVRIRFDGKVMHSWASRIQRKSEWMTIQRVISCMETGLNEDTYDCLPAPVESVSFHDVLYQYGKGVECAGGKRRLGGVFWNGLLANETRCGAFIDATICPVLASYVKEFPWSYECETRLVVTLEKSCPAVSQIAIPFVNVLELLQVTLGNKETSYPKTRDEIVRELTNCPKAFDKDIEWTASVCSSKYPVTFVKKDSKKTKSTEFLRNLPHGFGETAVSCRLESLHDINTASKLLQKGFWVYRGQYDATWKLATSLERSIKQFAGGSAIDSASERKAIWKFRNQTRLMLPHTDRLIDTLAAMQHYGAPTRLLDFTRTFLVALYFAFNKGDKGNKGNSVAQPENHAVWAINVGKAMERSSLIQAAVDEEIGMFQNNTECDNPNDWLEAEEMIRENSLDELRYDMHQRVEKTTALAEQLLHGMLPGTRPGILPIDIPGTNARMAAQDGMFIMASDFSPFESNLREAFEIADDFQKLEQVMVHELNGILRSSPNLPIVKFIIPDHLKRSVDVWLAKRGITHSRLFPDLVEIASHVQYNTQD